MAKENKKSYTQRFNQLLDIALQQFFQKGYAKTSIQNILDSAAIAKGTFYHYFQSKEDLLEKLLDRETARIMAPIQKVIDAPNLNALEKLNRLFKTAGLKKAENKEAMLLFARTFHSTHNLKFKFHLDKKTKQLILPKYENIIAQGIQEGLFDTRSAHDAAELIISISIGLRDAIIQLFIELEQHPENMDKLEAKMQAYEFAIERILGLSPGSIQIMNRKNLELFTFKKQESHL